MDTCLHRVSAELPWNPGVTSKNGLGPPWSKMGEAEKRLASDILFLYRSPSPRPHPDPTQHPEKNPKRTRNRPETEPNGAKRSQNGPIRGGTCGGGYKGKRKSLRLAKQWRKICFQKKMHFSGRCVCVWQRRAKSTSYKWEVYVIQIGFACGLFQRMPATELHRFAKVYYKVQIGGVCA